MNDVPENVPEFPSYMDSNEDSFCSIDLHSDETNDLDNKEEIQSVYHVEENPRRNSLNSWSNFKYSFKKVAAGSTGSIRKLKSMLKSDEKTVKDYVEEENSSICHDGILFVSIDEKNKDFRKNTFKIVGGQLKYIHSKTQQEISIPLTLLLSIQTVDEPKKCDGQDVFCFKVKFMSIPRYFLFGALSTTERLEWIQKLLNSVTDIFPLELISVLKKTGCATLKEGITSEWKRAWLLLHNRVIVFSTETCGLESIDLRKVRTVVTPKDKKLHTGVLLLDCITKSIYLKFNEDSEVLNWQHLIKSETVNSSPHLEDQQLSMDEVPVIVEKCIKFIYAHGCLSKGVYRQNGSLLNANKLLSAFSKDAWAVQLSLQEYSVNDVASVLKRFFRNLPESLFTREINTQLCSAGKCDYLENEKIILYRSILEQLPEINYVTLRKLLNHLFSIQLQSDENLMSVKNLASIWGPTLMHIESSCSGNDWSNIEAIVVRDLILLYPKLFDVKDDEIKRENRFLEAIKDINLSSGNAPQPSKPPEDLLFWIYLGSKYSDNCVSVTLSPSKTALMVCDELASKMRVRRGYSLGLQEVIVNGSMFRPIHYSEVLLDIILLWGYWHEKYRKDNYIVCLLPNSLLYKIIPFAKKTLTICGEFKLFADIKSKSYKCYFFEINEGKLICYKDKSRSTLLYEWFVKDIVWYIGFESNRNPNTRWCITFISKNSKHLKKPKDHFGWSIGGNIVEDHLRWMALLLLIKHGIDHLTPPEDTSHLLDS